MSTLAETQPKRLSLLASHMYILFILSNLLLFSNQNTKGTR